MKVQTTTRSISTLILAVAFAVTAVAQEQKPLTGGEEILVSATATVQAIDHAKREVTLKGPLGNVITFTVDKRVKRLNEVKVGDEVTADYFGYREDASALHDKAQAAYTASKNPNFFEAGALVIDVVDSKSYKLLERGYATRPLLKDLPEDARAARIQEVVDEILRDVRIAK